MTIRQVTILSEDDLVDLTPHELEARRKAQKSRLTIQIQDVESQLAIVVAGLQGRTAVDELTFLTQRLVERAANLDLLYVKLGDVDAPTPTPTTPGAESTPSSPPPR